MKISLYPTLSLCEPGQRNHNEDCIYPFADNGKGEESGRLYLICDGVGGEAKGEVASGIACRTFTRLLSSKDQVTEEEIKDAVRTTGEEMVSFSETTQGNNGMATTLVMIFFGQKGATVAHIGDSRAYQIRRGQVVFQTRDHSLINELISNKIISKEQALDHPQRNVISRAILGGVDASAIEISHLKDIRTGDYFFLCSDGILEGIAEEALVSLVGRIDLSDEEKLGEIKAQCNLHSRDNFSAHLIHVREVKNINTMGGSLVRMARNFFKRKVTIGL